jgi:putative PIN family toxin of toxin-antitoxin system
MDTHKIILDTNVLYAALYSSLGASYQILKRISHGRIKIVVSTTLLFEYEDILYRKKSDLGISDQQIQIILDNLCDLSSFQKIFFLWRPYPKDPKDDHILEVAVASCTATIVTHKLKDFKGVEMFGIKAITPKKLLEELI